MNKSKLVKYIKNSADWLYNNRCILVLSVAIGGFLSLYFISFCRTYFILNLDEGVTLIDFLTETGSSQDFEMTDLELSIVLISVMALIFSPLSFNGSKKIRFGAFGLGIILIFDLGIFLIMFISQRIDDAFVAVITFTCIYLVWLCLEILKIIYHWLRNLIGRKTK